MREGDAVLAGAEDAELPGARGLQQVREEQRVARAVDLRRKLRRSM